MSASACNPDLTGNSMIDGEAIDLLLTEEFVSCVNCKLQCTRLNQVDNAARVLR